MSKHSKKGKKDKKDKKAKKNKKKDKHAKHGKKHAKGKAAPLAKTSTVFRKKVGVTKDDQGNILVPAEAHRVHEHAAHEDDTGGAWNDYVSGGKNHDGVLIDDVLNRDDNYVVYLQGDRVIPEGDPKTLRKAYEIAPLLARVVTLKPATPIAKRRVNVEIARAYDLCFSGRAGESKAVLKQLLAGLESSRIAMARLHYVWAGIATSAACWLFIYGCYANGLVTADRLLWFQALGVGSTGGFFAVALSQRTIAIDLNHSTLVHWTSGISRILVAMAAAMVVLLAIKGGIFLGVADKSPTGYPELFFCFLAGFSETFVRTLLRNNENAEAPANSGASHPHAEEHEAHPKHKLLK